MSKAKTLAGTVSTGGPLADGEIGVSDVTGLQTALDGKAPGTAASASVGSELKLFEGTDNGTNYVSFKAANSLAGNVTWTLPTADGTNGQVLATNGTGTLSWSSASGSSQWTTTGSDIYYNTGNVGIGTTSPVAGVPLTLNTASGNNTNLAFQEGGTTKWFIRNINGNGGFSFYNVNTDNEDMLLTGTGLKTFSTISVGNATPSSSGAGITFPATQSASSDANTLDDYEEGSWTPTLTDGYTRTYSQRNGRYIKIGKQVYVFGQIQGSTRSGSAGSSLYITLPFPANEMAQVSLPSTIAQTYQITLTGAIVTLYAQWDAPTELRIAGTTAANIAADFQLGFYFVYLTNS